MRILGIDCGSHVTGYGVIEADGANRKAIGFGAIRTPRDGELSDRLRVVADGLDEVLAKFEPAEAAVEDVFQHVNARSAFTVAHVRGVALLSASRAGLPVASYAPAQVKNSVVGHGRANKDQVRMMVQVLLGVRGEMGPHDVSDALAVAFCHANLRDAARLGL